jgi:hypothetical protein
MKDQIKYEKKKIPGLCYAVMANGMELPVLDVTHHLFTSAIDDKQLAKYLKEVEVKGEKRAENFQKIPAFIKKFLAKRSFIMAEMLSEKKNDSFLSGLSTLLLKMGPYLIGKGSNRFFDRLASRGIGGIVLRMRLRDIAQCQADTLIPQLTDSPGKNLCFINIAGGTSCDSINALFLILKENPELLKNRNTEINVLDINPDGPDFADRSVRALKTGSCKFHDLNISFRYIPYNWDNSTLLENLLAERKDWLKICASEGGLFEYGSDEAIIQNLNILHRNSSGEITIAGSVLRDINTIDKGSKAAMKITGIKARMLGTDGLNSFLEKTGWKLDKLMSDNPRYIVFSLKKNHSL